MEKGDESRASLIYQSSITHPSARKQFELTRNEHSEYRVQGLCLMFFITYFPGMKSYVLNREVEFGDFDPLAEKWSIELKSYINSREIDCWSIDIFGNEFQLKYDKESKELKLLACSEDASKYLRERVKRL